MFYLLMVAHDYSDSRGKPEWQSIIKNAETFHRGGQQSGQLLTTWKWTFFHITPFTFILCGARMSAPKFMAIHQVSDVIFQPHHCHTHRHHIRAAINHKNNSSGPRLNVCGYSFYKAFSVWFGLPSTCRRVLCHWKCFLACPFWLMTFFVRNVNYLISNSG